MQAQRYSLVIGTGPAPWKLIDSKGKVRCQMSRPDDVDAVIQALNIAAIVAGNILVIDGTVQEYVRFLLEAKAA